MGQISMVALNIKFPIRIHIPIPSTYFAWIFLVLINDLILLVVCFTNLWMTQHFQKLGLSPKELIVIWIVY